MPSEERVEYTPRNPEAFYNHPLTRDLMKGVKNGPYQLTPGVTCLNRITEEVIESQWFAEYTEMITKRAWKEGFITALEETSEGYLSSRIEMYLEGYNE